MTKFTSHATIMRRLVKKYSDAREKKYYKMSAKHLEYLIHEAQFELDQMRLCDKQSKSKNRNDQGGNTKCKQTKTTELNNR